MDMNVLIFLATAATAIGLVMNTLMQRYWLGKQADALAETQANIEAYVQLAVRQHRENKAATLLVPDGLAWVSRHASAVYGETLDFNTFHRAVEPMRTVELVATDGRHLIVSPLTAPEIKRAQAGGKGRMAQAYNKALINGQKPASQRLTVLNAGDYFDLEAQQAGAAWGVNWESVPALYLHLLPAPRR